MIVCISALRTGCEDTHPAGMLCMTLHAIQICPRHPGSRETIRRQEVSLLHGLPAPPGFSRSCPHCVIPDSGAVTGQEYHYTFRWSLRIAGDCPALKPDVLSLALYGSWRIRLRRSHFRDAGKNVPDECVSSCS